MPLFNDAGRDQLRAFFFEAWRKRRERLPASPLELLIGDVIELHPEYHALLEDPDGAVDRDWRPESGDSNPFLHMGLHIAIREGAAADRPAGIAALRTTLITRAGDEHAAEHALLECLAETLWEAQRAGLPPDEQRYLERVRRLVG
jgi:hypothetical protein